MKKYSDVAALEAENAELRELLADARQHLIEHRRYKQICITGGKYPADCRRKFREGQALTKLIKAIDVALIDKPAADH